MPNMYKLKRVSDGQEFPLPQISTLVGRSASCDICIETGHASREHARITEKSDGLLVEDLHSTNGTFVNDHQIEEATLATPGSVIKFDNEAYCLQLQDDTDATVVMRPLAKDSANWVSSPLDDEDEDDEDEDSTVFIQAYPLPQGWAASDKPISGTLNESEKRKKAAIDRYLENSKIAKDGYEGLAIIFFVEDDPPIIKTISKKEVGKEWTFGRASNCDVVLDVPCISKLHGVFKCDNNQWVFEDAKSGNGVWLENKKLDKATLKDNLVFKIGNVQLQTRTIKPV